MLAPPRGVSPLAASFFAVRCHGILRMPLLLYSLIHLPSHIRLSSYTGKLQAKYQGSELFLTLNSLLVLIGLILLIEAQGKLPPETP